MQKKIIKAFDGEVERSKMPGYKPSYDEEFDEVDYVEQEAHAGGAPQARGGSPRKGSRSPASPDKQERQHGRIRGGHIVRQRRRGGRLTSRTRDAHPRRALLFKKGGYIAQERR